MSNVFLACPTYNGQLDFATARSLYHTASQNHRVHVMAGAASLLTANCNALWCMALNNRAHLTWFAMLHADIEPEHWWLDKLIAEAEAHQADLMSAVVPMKNFDGLVSTAIARPGGDSHIFCRLTMQQVRHPLFPDTFGIHEAADALEQLPPPLQVRDVPREALLANTGCFICRLDRPWSEQVWFSLVDGIEKVNGLWQHVTLSEDWVFSGRVARHGGKVMATRTVSLAHRGITAFESTNVWGHPRDIHNLPE